ncbi:aspartyl-tRNA synthetase [Sporosarcina sp. BI001-red]|uniref:aspartyl-tRNA synthetase n=1 Tax=Sporosarcina sp. BI001-red TaxID=2282866 RepID=UPI000E27331E|nr:aspartyl-tRNA synthetase [Sporosarcina sp. BI001-red]REB05530.1 aspartyl-tRNA synthetase [Sporosarcina sp. BI001-red]
MQRQVSRRWSIPILIVLFTGALAIWYFIESEESYETPQEAVLAVNPDLLLIPGYQLNKDSLFFFIKKTGALLGAIYAREGVLGWKAGFHTWGSSGINQDHTLFGGYQGQGNLKYGFIKLKDGQVLQMDNERVVTLDLNMMGEEIVEQYDVNGLYIWYVELDEMDDQMKVLQLIDEETDEVLDEIDIEA